MKTQITLHEFESGLEIEVTIADVYELCRSSWSDGRQSTTIEFEDDDEADIEVCESVETIEYLAGQPVGIHA